MIDALRAALDDDPMQRPASGHALVEALAAGGSLERGAHSSPRLLG